MRCRDNAKRMVLDDQGVLHPYAVRFRVKATAIVWVHRRDRSKGATVRKSRTVAAPVAAPSPAPRHHPLPKISLVGAPSGMEMAAAQWRKGGAA